MLLTTVFPINDPEIGVNVHQLMLSLDSEIHFTYPNGESEPAILREVNVLPGSHLVELVIEVEGCTFLIEDEWDAAREIAVTPPYVPIEFQQAYNEFRGNHD